jgi:hypothetical protein
VTLRTYDGKTDLWRIYWLDNTFSEGVIQPPVVGKFEGNVGTFEGHDTFNGIPIVVRYTWSVNSKGSQVAEKWEQVLNPEGSQVVAKWEQAFATDDGKTWETNWYNEFIHDDNCTPQTMTSSATSGQRKPTRRRTRRPRWTATPLIDERGVSTVGHALVTPDAHRPLHVVHAYCCRLRRCWQLASHASAFSGTESRLRSSTHRTRDGLLQLSLR